MAILVTGATGNIGSHVLAALAGKGAEVRAFVRSADKAHLPAGVTVVKGDLSDPDTLRQALSGVSTLFLLIANVADEQTQAMQALTVAHEAGIKGIVYFSVLGVDRYVDVPHFASKHAAERMIHGLKLPATILRPAYFIQNDVRLKDALLKSGVYGNPVGSKGISMVDMRDIGEAAAAELMRRERADAPQPIETYVLGGPDALTGEAIAAEWSQVLGKPIRYGGDDLPRYEQQLKKMLPHWHALDLRLMFERYQQVGAVASAQDLQRLTGLLGHPPRSYREFAQQTAAAWAKNP